MVDAALLMLCSEFQVQWQTVLSAEQVSHSFYFCSHSMHSPTVLWLPDMSVSCTNVKHKIVKNEKRKKRKTNYNQKPFTSCIAIWVHVYVTLPVCNCIIFFLLICLSLSLYIWNFEFNSRTPSTTFTDHQGYTDHRLGTTDIQIHQHCGRAAVYSRGYQ